MGAAVRRAECTVLYVKKKNNELGGHVRETRRVGGGTATAAGHTTGGPGSGGRGCGKARCAMVRRRRAAGRGKAAAAAAVAAVAAAAACAAVATRRRRARGGKGPCPEWQGAAAVCRAREALAGALFGAASGAGQGAPSSTSGNFMPVDAQTLRRAVALWKLYWRDSEDARPAQQRMAVLVALTFFWQGVGVYWSNVGADMWTALSKRDSKLFWRAVAKSVVLGFALRPVGEFHYLWQANLTMKWRAWLTRDALRRYAEARALYGISVLGEGGVSDPDERVATDIEAFVEQSTALAMRALGAAIGVIVHGRVLWRISPKLAAALAAYAAVGTGFSGALSAKLTQLAAGSAQADGDYRYALARLRDNAEAVALARGGQAETGAIMARYQDSQQLEWTRRIWRSAANYCVGAYSHLTGVLPLAVTAPAYFAGKIEMGAVQQATSSFATTRADLSFIFDNLPELSAFSSTVDRVHTFYAAFDQDVASQDAEGDAAGASREAVTSRTGGASRRVGLQHELRALENGNLSWLQVRDLTLWHPTYGADGGATGSAAVPAKLLERLKLELDAGDTLLICGASGAGKTSLLRALAGLWPAHAGHGAMFISSGARFLPQKPYSARVSLRALLLYPLPPNAPGTPTDEDMRRALEEVNLGCLPDRVGGFDATQPWDELCSLGEQQRLALAALRLASPRFCVLDESTSALDEDNTELAYALIRRTCTGFVSVGHRPSLARFHTHRLTLLGASGGGRWTLERIAHAPTPQSPPKKRTFAAHGADGEVATFGPPPASPGRSRFEDSLSTF